MLEFLPLPWIGKLVVPRVDKMLKVNLTRSFEVEKRLRIRKEIGRKIGKNAAAPPVFLVLSSAAAFLSNRKWRPQAEKEILNPSWIPSIRV